MSAPRRLLLHVGPHKTGTTTLQSALAHNRAALKDLGIDYVGPRQLRGATVRSLTGLTPPGPARDAGLQAWRRVLADVRHSSATEVVLSSEFFCEADDAAAARVATDLGDALHVVITLRGFAKVLPSQWQQFVQSGEVRTLPDYARWVLLEKGPDSDLLFWRRHRYDLLVHRWVRLLGPGRVSVIVSDSEDTGQLPREFAALLGVPAGLVVPESSVRNRSLTWEEAEGIRRFNLELLELNRERAEQGLPPALRVKERLGAWRQLKAMPPDPGHHRIELPESMTEPTMRVARAMTDALRGTAVDVRGPLEQLVNPPRVGGWQPSDPSGVAVPPLVATLGAELMRQVKDSHR